MKHIRRSVLALLVAALAVSCSYVYTGYIDGMVLNASGEHVEVYIFESREARDAAMADASDGKSVSGYYDRASVYSVESNGGNLGGVTVPSGSAGWPFSFGVIWETSNPEYGEDYDRNTYYFLAVDGTHTATEHGAEGVRVSSYSGHPASVVIDFSE